MKEIAYLILNHGNFLKTSHETISNQLLFKIEIIFAYRIFLIEDLYLTVLFENKHQPYYLCFYFHKTLINDTLKLALISLLTLFIEINYLMGE
ncbi:hypothetical protein BpHYR1_045312 [Brachionus plicatilis]|uniref:Uncharacterized protein n=1 Tax=Brachionus plicatilis TaxID=10195 RepID=A0A3M7SSK8_BRAPC|nr:hypothetical protein BpHYR1_045312 [Brachionus plicatilis]